MAESLDSYRARLDGAAIATYVMVMLIVPLKIWCRKKTGGLARLGLDDTLSVVTLVFANVFFYITMIGLRPYLGRHVGTDVSMEQVVDFLRYLFAASLTYVFAIAFIKLTILALYWKLFSITARVPIAILFSSVVIWMVVLVFVATFSCNPVEKQWNILIEHGRCMEQKPVYLGGSLPNVIIDFVLVGMPLPSVFRLNIPLGRRLILAGMFTLGFFICIVSIIRLTIVMSIRTDDRNVTYNLRDFMLWSTVEINIGLVCACLPSMRPLLQVIGLSRLFSTGRGTSEPSGPTGNSSSYPLSRTEGSRPRKKGGIFSTLAGLSKIESDEDEFQMIDDISGRQGKNKVEIGASRTSNETDSESRATATISVQKDWSVLVVGENSKQGNES
ncbi:hypothetical protein LCI18_007566 [Fusarium solani-melongenae]|uniref:Uncharacterized protein n=1 Tax=Fusarium solani subsp. cucurbitae TaxID=2747967 RepID=A0ACD3Z652_FUSSC|nr:hypothetical protein LCI18_007566 [Fusarium solani-melongenae]